MEGDGMADHVRGPEVEPGAEPGLDSDAERAIEIGLDDIDAKLKALEEAEMAVDSAYKTGRVERAKIT